MGKKKKGGKKKKKGGAKKGGDGAAGAGEARGPESLQAESLLQRQSLEQQIAVLKARCEVRNLPLRGELCDHLMRLQARGGKSTLDCAELAESAAGVSICPMRWAA